jgi:acetolactate synthase-1/2/3 large subunit
MKFTGASLLMSLLERHGTRVVAGIPGGANLPIYSALSSSSIEHILCRHEQGAGFIAQGIARSTGRTGVCLVTSGPGATNALTALADAKMDSVPMIMISGQVPLTHIGTDAFQEVDTYGMTIPTTKHNFLVRDAAELPRIVSEAYRLANSDRPGPVAIDIPKDIQKQEVDLDPESFPIFKGIDCCDDFNEESIRKIADRINEAEKPILYIGGGVINSECSNEIRELAVRSSIPVVSSLMGLGAFPTNHSLFVGMIGMHGDFHTNHFMNEADVVVALGVRFDDRATGKISDFIPNASVIHIDIDESEIDKIIPSSLKLQANLKPALSAIIPYIEETQRTVWNQRLAELKEQYPIERDWTESLSNPEHIIDLINKTAPEGTIITTDVGQHQMWAARHCVFTEPRTWLTSGGLGTMGFGLPAAIGAAKAHPGKRIICITGDGSLLMNIQELATVADLGSNIAIVLYNNQSLGLVRQQQELFYGKNYFASEFKTAPDFAKLAESFGLEAYSMKEGDEALFADKLMKEGPILFDIAIDRTANVYPIVPPGKGNTQLIGGKA